MKIKKISTLADLQNAVQTLGFLPFFRNEAAGFSIEEHITLSRWFPADGDGVWEWKGPVIRATGCAYGKFFCGKAVFISREWYPDFANFRRNGYDFDALYDDGLARREDKLVYDLIEKNQPIISKELKHLGDFRKGGNKGFDSIIMRLQMQGYITTSDFVYQTDKTGNAYGWGVAEYETAEHRFGDDFTANVYRCSPQESKEKIISHLKKLLPKVEPSIIEKLISKGAVSS